MLWLAGRPGGAGPPWRRGARASLVAVVVGCLTFLPWLPIFLFQSRHTGPPGRPGQLRRHGQRGVVVRRGSTNQGRALALIFFALAGLGLFGVATDRRHIDLDIRTRPLGRPLAIVVVGTLAAALAGGFLTNSAFDARYASVVFIPLILLVAIGLTTFRDRRVRAGGAGRGRGGRPGRRRSPTSPPTGPRPGRWPRPSPPPASPGDVVAYCPDQLGPAVNRLLPAGRYQQTTFPRGTGPAFVNWVDYAAGRHGGPPVSFAEQLESLAAARNADLPGVGRRVPGLRTQVRGHRPDPAGRTPTTAPRQLVVGNDTFYQPMWLVRFTPTKP